jgi:hypothetical protein
MLQKGIRHKFEYGCFPERLHNLYRADAPISIPLENREETDEVKDGKINEDLHPWSRARCSYVGKRSRIFRGTRAR